MYLKHNNVNYRTDFSVLMLITDFFFLMFIYQNFELIKASTVWIYYYSKVYTHCVFTFRVVLSQLIFYLILLHFTEVFSIEQVKFMCSKQKMMWMKNIVPQSLNFKVFLFFLSLPPTTSLKLTKQLPFDKKKVLEYNYQ